MPRALGMGSAHMGSALVDMASVGTLAISPCCLVMGDAVDMETAMPARATPSARVTKAGLGCSVK